MDRISGFGPEDGSSILPELVFELRGVCQCIEKSEINDNEDF
jgi:hypothetical protein